MKKLSSDVITGKTETIKYSAFCMEVKIPELWDVLRELDRETKLRWKGTNYRPASGVPYPKLAGGIKYLRAEKGIMSYHASVDAETKVLGKNKFLERMKKEFGR